MSNPDVVLPCPFCGRGLTAADATRHGRYGCPDCGPTSREALHGWTPSAPITKSATNSPEAKRGLSRAAQGHPWFAHSAKTGEPITRTATCECGQRFTQTLLSQRFLSMVETHDTQHRGRAMAHMDRDVPGGYVPVHCPKCERVDLGQRARLSGYTYHPEAAD